MEVEWCTEHGLPHSTLLGWSDEDRAKLTAFLLERSARCQMCGSAEWEWEENRNAYVAQERVCMGCMLKDRAGDTQEHSPGGRIVLVPRSIFEREAAAEAERAHERSD